MPASRYRLVRPLPPRIDYASVSYALEIVEQRHDTIPMNAWFLRARKLNAEPVCVIAWALAQRENLEHILANGIEIENGTPAAKIMERLTRDGIAEKARAGWR